MTCHQNQLFHLFLLLPPSSTTHSIFRISFTGDTSPTHFFSSEAQLSTILLHECAQQDSDEGHAVQQQHSTISQALLVAESMCPVCSVLTHFSQRFPKSMSGTEMLKNLGAKKREMLATLLALRKMKEMREMREMREMEKGETDKKEANEGKRSREEECDKMIGKKTETQDDEHRDNEENGVEIEAAAKETHSAERMLEKLESLEEVRSVFEELCADSEAGKEAQTVTLEAAVNALMRIAVDETEAEHDEGEDEDDDKMIGEEAHRVNELDSWLQKILRKAAALLSKCDFNSTIGPVTDVVLATDYLSISIISRKDAMENTFLRKSIEQCSGQFKNGYSTLSSAFIYKPSSVDSYLLLLDIFALANDNDSPEKNK
ncbi:uncharacterized protein MONOS_10457 [Monocercomonoides exilis]|uniref:uncharacterized protein n=1 Tax=Monocercomonoides exilis TaxID=2049356 RepID=UPI00355A3F0C|nr:hypothetical protein MONOS_10457 [Monocercomonoides exilis]|eukprot:MONOS_10457.1-p1 / transcript=MONOS_10457.1 / gene=MONOS_10457 / organism=Monocercomonoides_exilis_PA203 / gene_product=unspecified product / transcript_product=unspecified product / location=Mono_scaffold00476:47999-49123(-) / protein_length=374 / sequence_SO=supercontig / SO=protein_coding / is_pseudo=false